MKTIRSRFLLCILVLLALSSCARKIDGSSENAFKDSVKEIRETLNPQKKNAFNEALDIFILKEETPEKLGTEKKMKGIRQRLSGMTATALISEGKEIKEHVKKWDAQKVKSLMTALQEKKKNFGADSSEIAKFTIRQALFYKIRDDSVAEQSDPVIQLKVQNGTDIPVSKAYFSGIFTSPVQKNPWLSKVFDYSFPKMLLPQKEQTLYIKPGIDSDWGKLDLTSHDGVFLIRVIRLDDGKGRQAFSVEGFDEYQKWVLKGLLRIFPQPSQNKDLGG